MSEFPQLNITNKGAALLTKLSAEDTLTITKVALGNGVWPYRGVVNPKREKLTEQQVSFSIQAVGEVKDFLVNLTALLQYSDLGDTGFYATELGIFATDPDDGEILLCCSYAGDFADWIPGTSETLSYEHVFQLTIATGKAGSVAASDGVDSMPVLKSDLEKDLAPRVLRLESPLLRLLTPNNPLHTGRGILEYSRSTTATYVDRSGLVMHADIDEPREEADGWLFEGESENLVLESNVPTTATVTPVSTTKTAPDGTATAREYDLSDGENSIKFGTGGVVAGDNDCTASIWIKGNKGETIRFGISWKSMLLHTFKGGWERISNTRNPVGETLIVVISNGNDCSATTIQVWGAQLEKMPFATSLIPTDGTAKSRGKDVFKLKLESNNYPRIRSYVPLSITGRVKSLSLADTQEILTISNGYTKHSCLDLASNGGLRYRRGDVYVNSESSVASITDIAVVMSADNIAQVYAKGLLVAQGDLQDNADSEFSIVQIDSDGTFFGHLSDIRVYDFKLTHAEVLFLAQGPPPPLVMESTLEMKSQLWMV